MLAFLAVYVAGYFNLHTKQALLLGEGRDHLDGALRLPDLPPSPTLVRRGRRFTGGVVRWFVIGLTANAVYGIVQLVLQAGAGINLDKLVVGAADRRPGQVQRHQRLRPGRRQPEHLPHQRAHRRPQPPRRDAVRAAADAAAALPGRPPRPPASGPAAAVPAVVQVLTLSRSAALGDIVGLLVLSPVILPRLPRRAHVLLGAGRAGGGAGRALYTGSGFVRDRDRQPHQHRRPRHRHPLPVLPLVPPALDPHPLLGMGYNTFAVFYQFLTGKTDFGPHSFWVATLVETGMLGLALYLCLLRLGVRLRAAHPRHRGRRGAAAGVRPGWRRWSAPPPPTSST